MKTVKHIPSTFNQISQHFSPKIIGEVNDIYVKLVKILGDKVPWHIHEHEDELFYILEGSLLMEIKNQPSFTMNKGDLFVVEKGLEHRVSATNECHIMLIENKTAAHTGNVVSDISKSINDQLDNNFKSNS